MTKETNPYNVVTEVAMAICDSSRPLVKSVSQFIFYFSTKTYVVGSQKNGLNETVLLSTQNIC